MMHVIDNRLRGCKSSVLDTFSLLDTIAYIIKESFILAHSYNACSAWHRGLAAKAVHVKETRK